MAGELEKEVAEGEVAKGEVASAGDGRNPENGSAGLVVMVHRAFTTSILGHFKDVSSNIDACVKSNNVTGMKALWEFVNKLDEYGSLPEADYTSFAEELYAVYQREQAGGVEVLKVPLGLQGRCEVGAAGVKTTGDSLQE